ncbi:hypothetical protein V8C44DRAFT_315085 [Trichoderma aethiopicum]
MAFFCIAFFLFFFVLLLGIVHLVCNRTMQCKEFWTVKLEVFAASPHLSAPKEAPVYLHLASLCTWTMKVFSSPLRECKCRVTDTSAMFHVVRIPRLGIMPSQRPRHGGNPMSLLTQHHNRHHHQHHHDHHHHQHPHRQLPLEHPFGRCPTTQSMASQARQVARMVLTQV